MMFHLKALKPGMAIFSVPLFAKTLFDEIVLTFEIACWSHFV